MKKLLFILAATATTACATTPKTGDMVNQALHELETMMRAGINLRHEITTMKELYCGMVKKSVTNITAHHRGIPTPALNQIPCNLEDIVEKTIAKLQKRVMQDNLPLQLDDATRTLLNDLPESVHAQVAQLRGGTSVGVFIGILFFPVLMFTSLLEFGINQTLALIPFIGPIIAIPFATLSDLSQAFFAFLTL